MKGRQLQKIWDKLPSDRKQKIQARANELASSYQSLQDLRKALGCSQVSLAEALDIHQVNISKIENRSDIKLSTLNDYLAALGGKLKIIAEFPGEQTIEITGFCKLDS